MASGCHDRNTNTILMDAYVVFLASSRLQDMTLTLESMEQEHLLSVKLSKEESVLWKQLMPCLVENFVTLVPKKRLVNVELGISSRYRLLTASRHFALVAMAENLKNTLMVKNIRNWPLLCLMDFNTS